MFEKIYLEISNICNLKCNFCPEVLREKEIISLEKFENALVKVKERSKRICLHLMGEPLGHPHFSEIIEICEKHSVQVELTTNGVLLNDRKISSILSPAVVQVNISVHSFEANHGQKDMAPYLEKVFNFADMAMSKRPDMYINYRIWDLSDVMSLSPKNQLTRELIEKKYDFNFSSLKVDIRRKKGYAIKDRLYVHFDSRFEWPDIKGQVLQQEGFCHALTHHIGIHANGIVVPCCLDKEAVMPLGNIFESDLDEILNSAKALSMKEGFAKRKLNEELCKRCDYIRRF